MNSMVYVENIDYIFFAMTELQYVRKLTYVQLRKGRYKTKTNEYIAFPVAITYCQIYEILS